MSLIRPVSIFSELNVLDRQLVALTCPACGADNPSPIWRRDRYFLRVELSSCGGCGLIYLARGLRGTVQANFYQRLYPRLMKQPPALVDLWHYRLIAGYRYSQITAQLGTLDSVLDVGAGLGFFLEACREHGAQQLVGLEPGEPQREHAVRELGLGEQVRAEGLDDNTELSFAPRLVTLFHVLEHLEEPGRALRRLAQLADPQGWLVLEVPDIEADWRAMGLIQVHVSHRSYFSEHTLRSLLAANGWRVEIVQREAAGIYCGNLRVFARPSTTVPVAIDSRPALDQQREWVRKQINPWSFRHGYPRSAMRLLRLALRRSRD